MKREHAAYHCEPILASVLYEKRLSIITTSGSLHYYSLANPSLGKPEMQIISLLKH